MQGRVTAGSTRPGACGLFKASAIIITIGLQDEEAEGAADLPAEKLSRVGSFTTN